MADRNWPEKDDRRFYVQRGIPVVPIATFLFALMLQTVLGVRYISELEAEVNSQGRRQIEFNSKLEKVEVKLDTVATAMHQGNVPAALNQRAITDVERQLGALGARIADLERKQAESMHGRAR